MMTLPGKQKLVCIGNYRMTGRRLGQGNFAKVEEAYHTVLKTKVAVKVMNVAEITEDYVVRNLHREAKIMSRLSHPYIAALFETIQHDTTYYLVTELVNGGDLCTFMKAQHGGKLEERSTKGFGRQLVSALAYMHSVGIVHRDLKMENIILNETKTQLKIVDFGLSNIWHASALLRTHCGSPEYAAPELFVSGQLYGPQVDLWSLGVIFYGMVMGQLPFLSPRDTRITPQDKRKNLIAQINRGLTPTHRKCLTPTTIEFRGMLARLLTPDPIKRLRITELVRHPWVTDRNKKPLRTTGFKELDEEWKHILLKEITKLSNMQLSHVEYELETQPYGAIAGMFNILSFRRMVKEATLIVQDHHHHQQQQHNQRPASSYSNRVTPVACEVIRPKTVGISTAVKTKEWKAQVQDSPTRLRVVGTRNIIKTYNLRNTSVKKPSTSRIQVSQRETATTMQGTLPNRRTKSAPQTRTTTASTANQRTVKRRSDQQPQHRQQGSSGKSEVKKPVVSTKSCTSRTQTVTITTPPLPKPHRTSGTSGVGYCAIPRCHRPATTPSEIKRSCGTATRKSSVEGVSTTKQDKNLLNEPIARCIAGYVGKYMNSHGSKFKWIKDFASFNNPSRAVNN